MTVRYHQYQGRMAPDYVCQKAHIENHEPLCQQIPGASIDEAIGKLLVESVTPLALEVVLQVQAEIQTRLEEASRLRQQQVQRAEYEANQARVRYLRVDPNNRLVADTLETQWNQKLRTLAEAREEAEKHRRADEALVSEEQRARVLALASDFPRLWQDPKTTDRDRKRMARLLVEDVTLQRDQDVAVQVRFKGGATRELRLPLPKSASELRKTKAEVVAEIDHMLDEHTEGVIAHLLNERGWVTGTGRPFTLRIINNLRRTYRLKSRFTRLREKGLLTANEVAPSILCIPSRVKYWRHVGVLTGLQYSEKEEYLYPPPTIEIVELILRRRGKRHHNPSCLSSSQRGAV
ncbi:MAG: hypothetical protein JNK85_10155 [Verrucomicrobiales bacterium]|nr:hypothetical protein [Verrucomicrobiales bacterium]